MLTYSSINYVSISNILLVATVAHLLFGLFLISSKNEARISNKFFSLGFICIALWAFSCAIFFRVAVDSQYIVFWAHIIYLSAIFIPVSFLFFVLSAWGKDNAPLGVRHLLITTACIFVVFFTVMPGMLIDSVIEIGGIKKITFGYFHPVYVIFIVSCFIASFVLLLRRYLSTKGLTKIQIGFIFFGTFFTSLIGVFTNLIFPYKGYFGLFWVGPLATIIVIVFLAYAVVRHQLFKTKLIISEILIFLIWLVASARVLFSPTNTARIIDIGVLITMIILGIFLIRSVIKEINAREQMSEFATSLKKANMRLQELDRQKSEFVSIASHQLKSPLTAIKGYASLLLEESFGRLSVKNKEPVQRIFESSVRLVNVIEDFLNITRIEQGRMKFEFQNADLLAMIRDIVKEFEPTIERAGLAVVVRADERKTYTVSADVSKLRQVLSNLIDNAIKYTPKGNIDIELTKDEAAGTITLCVRDTGIGFSPETKVILFQKFGRGDGVEKLHTEGSGIGLYIAREIIRSHKGHIRAESEGLGKGSMFCVELPMV